MTYHVLEGVVIRGHQVASGLSPDTPYLKGSIAMQLPFFRERGGNFEGMHSATMNVSIAPYSFQIIRPDYFFEQVEWTDRHPPENFSFVGCQIFFNDKWQAAFIYYPHPETKKTHFSNDTILEILTVYMEGIVYGSKVRIRIPTEKVKIIEKNKIL